MKKTLCALAALLAFATFLFGGCDMLGGGTTENNVTVNNTYQTMTDGQWEEYKNLLAESGTDNNLLTASVNGSLLSGVSIFTTFTYNDVECYTEDIFGRSTYVGKLEYHAVYCGAGVIVEMDKESGNAYVVTNCHVVYDDSSKEKISNDVRLYLYGQDTEGINYTLDATYVKRNGKEVFYREDGDEYYLYDYSIKDDENYCVSAEVIGASDVYDIALLKVSNSAVLKNSAAKVAEFSASDDVYTGQSAYAVGNPEGEGMSVTMGIVSKESENILLNLSEVDEKATKSYRVIRTDAAVNGGNSGGGFYNAQGKLIGIINSKSTGDDIDNMGYALPAGMVSRLWKLMKETDETSPSYFTKSNPYVKVAKFPVEYNAIASSSHLNLQGYAEIEETVEVSASGSGFMAGDILKHITILNGGQVVEDKDITRAYHVEDTLLSARQGYTVKFTVLRKQEEKVVSYTASLEKA